MKYAPITLQGKKLDIFKAAEIKELGNHGLKAKEVATWYGVNESMVCHIWHGRHWAGVERLVKAFNEPIAA